MPLPYAARLVGAQFEKGIWPDLGGDSAPLLADARNIMCAAGQVTPAPGTVLILNGRTGALISTLSSQYAYDKTRVFYASGGAIYEWDGAERFSRGDFDGVTQLAPFGNFTLAANGGPLLAKRGDNVSFAAIAGAPAADFVISVSPYVLTFKDRIIHWCARDDLDTWAPADDNDAGELPIRNMDSNIRAVLPRGLGAAVFSADGLWIVSYIGPDFYFGVEKVPGLKIGAVGRNAVCEAEGLYYGVSQSTIWVSDGNSQKALDSPAVHDKFFNDLLDPGRVEDTLVWNDAVNSRVVIDYWDRSGKRACLYYSTKWQNWVPGTVGYLTADRFDAWPQQLLATADGLIFGQTSEIIPVSAAVVGGIRTRRKVRIEDAYGSTALGTFPYGPLELNEDLPVAGSNARIKITYTSPGGKDFIYPAIQSGVTETVWMETKDLDFMSQDWKYIDEIIIKLQDASRFGSLALYYAKKDRLSDEAVWHGPYSLAYVDSPFQFRVTTRYIRLKIVDTFVRGRWVLTGIDFNGRVAGGRR